MNHQPEQHRTIVLDTNVCLDLFVFADPRWTKLRIALQEGRLEAITRESCRNEWLAVLHYQQLPITDENRPGIIHDFDSLVRCIYPTTTPTTPHSIKLPTCSDKDDQQFMELARDGRATHLITKDKALLKCARKVAKLNLFQILSPENFLKSVEF